MGQFFVIGKLLLLRSLGYAQAPIKAQQRQALPDKNYDIGARRGCA
jgi:hypothetical protein